MRRRLIQHLPLLILLSLILIPYSRPPSAQGVEVVVEDPLLDPTFTTCPETYWYPIDNDRGHTTYLTLNTNNPSHSTNLGEWHPVIPQAGYYRVEAYIAAHPAITWCTGDPPRVIAHDTTDAHYSIHHAYGVTNRSLSQYPLSNQWLDLGEYYFAAGNNGYVDLTDLNYETEYTTTVSFSAMRFTFIRLPYPFTFMPLVNHSDPTAPPPDTGVINTQGFDACHLPSISQMQTWWNQSPYHFYALYLGGIALYHECLVADSAWVSAVHLQGWSFVPTWVGPQAPCSDYIHKMSADPAVSYLEGRSEAEAASSAAANMGLTNYGLGGTIIYYDLEAFGIPECRQAVSAFMNGWVERLHELGNLAGGYGAACSSYPTDWSTIPNAPDDIWAAYMYTGTYDANASVWGLPCLNDNLWSNHQRIRQYAWGHNERWGGVELPIDSNVADGMVAMPPTTPPVNPVVISSPAIQDSGWLSSQQGWLVMDNRLFWTQDRGQSWQIISPADIQLAFFLPSGEAWALSAPPQGGMDLLHTPASGAAWESLPLPMPTGSWHPLQVHFTSPASGWVVLQKVTSSAFSLAMLLKTTDGGLTWQTYDLPIAAPLSFMSPTQGWVSSSATGELYHTLDGGLTWQPATRDQYPYTSPALSGAITQSGWGSNGLGWVVTSDGNCTSDKSSPGFTCQMDTTLWQTTDGGGTWQSIPLPTISQ
jgi:Rv2525c-like, glycoside hydrolase-like domain